MLATLIAGIAIFLIIIATFLYLAAVHHNGYWRRRGVAGPPPRPFVGNMNEWFRRVPLSLQLHKWTEQYGKVYGIQEGRANVFVTSDIQLLQELFVTKFKYFHGRKLSPELGNVDRAAHVHTFSARGARWKRLRAIANPAFSVSNLKKILPILHDSTRVMMDFFDKAGRNGSSINVINHFHELSLDVIMRVAMGQHGSRQFDNVENVHNMTKQFESFSRSRFFYYGRILGESAYPAVRAAAIALAILTRSPVALTLRYIADAIQQRKAMREQEKSRDDANIDFIDIFLDMENASALQAVSEKTFDKAASKVSKKMTADELKAQCYVFMLAGFDTTANSLSVTCHYLARHPEAQSRLRDEILDVCGEDENPGYEQLQQLRYADAVIKEALRICPVAGAVCARQCSKTTTLGQYTIEEGTYVQADVFAIHRDREVWGKDADEFRPDRWLEEGAAERASLSWMPFGAGPRLCVGMRLAYLEEKLALVRLLRTYAIRTAPDSETTMDLHGEVVLSPERVIVSLVPLEWSQQ